MLVCIDNCNITPPANYIQCNVKTEIANYVDKWIPIYCDV